MIGASKRLTTITAIIVVFSGTAACQSSPDEPRDEMIVETDGQEVPHSEQQAQESEPHQSDGDVPPIGVQQESSTTVEEHSPPGADHGDNVPPPGAHPTPDADADSPSASDTQRSSSAPPHDPPAPDPATERTDSDSPTTAPPQGEQPPPSVDDNAPTADADLPSSPDEVTDDQIEEFASVYIDVMELQLEYAPRIRDVDDTEEATRLQRELEQRAMDVVDDHQLSHDEFDAIAHLLEHDESLRDRIQSEVDDQAYSH